MQKIDITYPEDFSMIRGVVSVEKSSAMKSYERARANVEAGRIVKFDSLDDLKAYYDKL